MVTLGSLHAYWLKPLLQCLNGIQLCSRATDRTALATSAMTGGSATATANTLKPAGLGILQDAELFAREGISSLELFLSGFEPTMVAVVFLRLLHRSSCRLPLHRPSGAPQCFAEVTVGFRRIGIPPRAGRMISKQASRARSSIFFDSRSSVAFWCDEFQVPL